MRNVGAPTSRFPLRVSRFTLRGRSGMTALEAIVAVALISGCLGAAAVYQTQVIQHARALALRADLQSLRAAIAFFQATHGRYPATLEEVLIEPLGGVRHGQAAAWSLQDRGQQRVDAFGNPYYYDARQGVVHSMTRGYETQ